MAIKEAVLTGLRLGRQGRHQAAVPYFRRAVTLDPDSWTVRENYASTLYNGALETRTHLGKDEPATRSSVERMTMIGQSLSQTDEALRLAPEPTDQAMVLFQRAQAFHTFGFALDALVEFRNAAGLHPGSGKLANATVMAEARLRSGGPE
jgi:Tfp pilus assembly protein PilF